MTQRTETVFDADGNAMYTVVETERTNQTFIRKPIYGSHPLLRVGFLSPVPMRYRNNPNHIHDSRAIAWPVYHPYWVVRMSADANMMMAYVNDIKQVTELWPEAEQITVFEEHCMQYMFNGNFPEPDWLAEVQADDFQPKPRRIGAWRVVNPETGKSIIGYSDDCDYAIQLNNHKLEYGTHEDLEFQRDYTMWQDMEVQYRPTETIEQAKRLAQQLRDFDEDSGDLETNLPI